MVGELVNTAGPGRFEGYYNDEAAEAERMAGGVYHSGDLAYRDDAGYAYFAGRLGDWMRVDGENLGAAPIERVLLRYPDVTEVAVYAVPDPVVGDQVMAALVLAPGAEFDAEKFRAFLAEQPDLGPKQWPSYVRVSAELPRTVTFKVLKRQLAAAGCGLRRSGVADSPVDMTSRPLETALEASFEQLSAAVPADLGIAIARPDRTYSLGRWWSGCRMVDDQGAVGDRGAAQRLAARQGPCRQGHHGIRQSGVGANVVRFGRSGGSGTAGAGCDRRGRRHRHRGRIASASARVYRVRPDGVDLAAASRFAAELPSIPDSADVIDLMQRLTSDHRWGLAAKGLAAKGGWGPGMHGDYLVRQFGIVPTPSGQWGVALAARVHDGAFETGVDVLDTVSEWVLSRLPGLARY